MINKLLKKYWKLDRDISARYTKISDYKDDYRNWYGREGYTHYLKPRVENAIESHERKITEFEREQTEICKQVTIQDFKASAPDGGLDGWEPEDHEFLAE
jgi:hypothetical protein